MKRVLSGLLAIELLAGVAFAQAPGKKVEFSLDVGLQTNWVWGEMSFTEGFFTVGARVGLSLGKSFDVSPEFTAAIPLLEGGAVILYPGVLLDWKIGRFFVGAGGVLPIDSERSGAGTWPLSPKIHIGYRGHHLILTAYLVAFTRYFEYAFPKWKYIGVTLGYGF